jgi:protein required for attachment to host cells
MKLWIVIADASVARIFSTDGADGPLQVVDSLIHSASRARDADVNTDRPGRVRKHLGQPGVFAMAAGVSPHETEAHRFARQVADALHDGLNRRAFDLLALVAPPHFMGVLREALDPHVARRVVTSVKRDLGHVKEHELRQRLGSVLEAVKREEHRHALS